MQAIINQAITTAWTDVEIDQIRASGNYEFWSRGGAAFRIRMPGQTAYATIKANSRIKVKGVYAVGGVLFQAQTITGSETIEVLISEGEVLVC